MRADAKKNYDQLLAVAGVVVTEEGAEASLRDIARKAGVGLGTMYRHFPTRETLLETLLRTGFDDLAAKAAKLETADSAAEALISWLHEFVSCAANYRGVITLMVDAIDDPDSALHASCVAMRAAGARLLTRAQTQGTARPDLTPTDLYALGGSLAWVHDQPALAPRADHLFTVITDAILTTRR